jgi:hypothetical protein
MKKLSLARVAIALSVATALTSCDDNEIDSEEAARAAYLGLDGAIEKALNLGMDGYNAASSANIPPQTTSGGVTGTLTVSGQVDQGASDNKEMRLLLTLVEYQDEVPDTELVITYDTDDADLPQLDLSLRNIPNGTFTGTLIGDFYMIGDIEGLVTLNLTLTGQIEASDTDETIQRVAGTTTVTGTATSSYDTFAVDVVL